jgi:adenosylcobyric acid synthase
VPFFAEAGRLPAEDSLALERKAAPGGKFLIAVPRLPRIANFDDLDPLRAEPGVTVEIVEPGGPLPQAADLIILPGSKATRADLATLRQMGWDIDILAHHRAGKPVFGICGGYQMLGKTIADPKGIEGDPGLSRGLGLLNVETTLGEMKDLRIETAVHAASGAPITGYHMHMGVTAGHDRGRPFAHVGGDAEGAVSADALVTGTYLHGLFASDAFRHAFLGEASTPLTAHEARIDETLDALAAHLELHLDLDALLALAGEV